MSAPDSQDPPLEQSEELSLSEGKSPSEEQSPSKDSSQEETTPPEERPVKGATSLRPSLSDVGVTGDSTPAGGKTPEEITPSGGTSSWEEGTTPTDAAGRATSPRELVAVRSTKFADEETTPTDSAERATSPRESPSVRSTKFADEETTPTDAAGRATSPRESPSVRSTKFADEETTPTDAAGRATSPREIVAVRSAKFADEMTTPTDETGRAASPREPSLSFRETKFADEVTAPRDSTLRATTPKPTALKATISPEAETSPKGWSPMEDAKGSERDASEEQPASPTTEKEQTSPQQPAEETPAPPPPPPPLPKASPEAIDFLASITSDDLALMHFTDSLVTVSDMGTELGEFIISFHPIICERVPGVGVNASSHGSIDSIPCGTSISARVSGALETMELQHHEYIKLKEHSLTKKTVMKKGDDGYVMTREVTVGEGVKSETLSFSLADMKGFVSEASNLVLLRIMAQRNHVPDNMVFLAFDTEMQLSTSTYLNLGPKMLTIGKSEVEVLTIQRTIHSEVNSPMSWQCSFLPDGHLTSRVQVGSPITMRLRQLPYIKETDVIDPKPVFEKKPLNWEDDMQLYFKFIDKTEALKADYSSYIRHHPELKCMMADFLEFVLLRKPQDVVTFAAEYFASFSAFEPKQSSFLSSKKKSPFRET
ncbi:ciliogenesis-associated TTC17-interacting protein [Rhinoraja longicauda]